MGNKHRNKATFEMHLLFIANKLYKLNQENTIKYNLQYIISDTVEFCKLQNVCMSVKYLSSFSFGM